MARYYKGSDPWGRGSYSIPEYAVMGSSITGEWSDSPAPTSKVKDELNGFRKVLRQNGIRSRFMTTRSGNVFMVKLWVVVDKRNFLEAKSLADEYLKKNDRDLRFAHDAEGD